MNTLSAPPELQVYRCVVLGDRTSCPVTPFAPGERIDVEVVPGPCARYLMYVGQDRDRAIASARRIGEKPVRRVTRVTTRPLSGIETYERNENRLARPQTMREVLSEVPIEEAGPENAR